MKALPINIPIPFIIFQREIIKFTKLSPIAAKVTISISRIEEINLLNNSIIGENTPVKIFTIALTNSVKNPGIVFANDFICSQYLVKRYIIPAISPMPAVTIPIPVPTTVAIASPIPPIVHKKTFKTGIITAINLIIFSETLKIVKNIKILSIPILFRIVKIPQSAFPICTNASKNIFPFSIKDCQNLLAFVSLKFPERTFESSFNHSIAISINCFPPFVKIACPIFNFTSEIADSSNAHFPEGLSKMVSDISLALPIAFLLASINFSNASTPL